MVIAIALGVLPKAVRLPVQWLIAVVCDVSVKVPSPPSVQHHHHVIKDFGSALHPAWAGLLCCTQFNAGSTVSGGRGREFHSFVSLVGMTLERHTADWANKHGWFQTFSLNDQYQQIISTKEEIFWTSCFSVCLWLFWLQYKRMLLAIEVYEDVYHRNYVLNIQTVVELWALMIYYSQVCI